jgi:intergrase/recombinase
LQVMAKGDIRYCLVYEVALDSGLRLIEACNLINNFHQAKIERHGDFVVIPLGLFRHTKVAYFGFITAYTMDLLTSFSGSVDWALATNYVRKREDVIAYKYLRKFANDTMTNEQLNISESTADFIQGRTPKSVAAKHYMQLKRKALQFYPRYAKYLEHLRRKAGFPSS